MSKKYVLVKKSNILTTSLIDFVGYSLQKLGLAFRQKKVDVSQLKPKKVLIITLDYLGDALFSTPAVRAIRKRFPKAGISVLVGSWSKDVFEGSPYVDEAIIFDAPWFKTRREFRPYFRVIREEAQKLRERNFDLGIDLRGDFHHLVMMYWAGIPVRVSYGVTGGGFLLSLNPPFSWEKHTVQRKLALVEALGADVFDDTLEMPVIKEAQGYIDALLEEQGVSHSSRLIGVHPGAATAVKRWGAGKFAKAGDTLAQNYNATVAITGSSSEIELAEEVRSQMKARAINLAGKTNLKQLAALLSRLNVFICGDTGPLHVAMGVKTPVVAIYSGQNDPKIWGPYGGDSVVLYREVGCNICGKEECSDRKCMDSITPEEVVAAAEKFLR